MSRFGNGSNSNGQFWYGSATNFPGFLYKKNVGVGGRRSTKFAAGGNSTTNTNQYLYNKYKPGQGGVGASSIANRRAKNRLATICNKDGVNNCYPCYKTLGQYNRFLYNPNGFYPCLPLNTHKHNLINQNPPNQSQPNENIINNNFLVYKESERGPGNGALNENFGWDTNGMWFSGNANKTDYDTTTEIYTDYPKESYPIFTSFSIPSNKKVSVSFNYTHTGQEGYDFEGTNTTEANDFGICFYDETLIPYWNWDNDGTRISIQSSFKDIHIYGLYDGEKVFSETPIFTIGETYNIVINYEPLATSCLVSCNVYSNTGLVATLAGNFSKIQNNYKIGFCADRDTEDLPTGYIPRTYFSFLKIDINDGEIIYKNDLTNLNLQSA